MAQGYITIGTELDTKSFDKQIQELEDKLTDLEGQELYFSKNNMTGELEDVQVEMEKTRNKIVQLNNQKNKLADTTAIDKMGKSFQGAIKNASRLVLSIFGIRTAYMMLRNASSSLSQYDEQYAANLEYIRYVLTQAIAPVLRGIVQLAMQLLQFINMIVNALFGVNLFARGSVENFQKMKVGATGVGKAVKEIKKQLLGFDEVNILSDQSDTGTQAGAGGVTMPSMDLSSLQGEVPKWMQWIIEHGPLVTSILAGIAGTLAGLKIANLLKSLGVITKIPISKIVGIGVGIGGIVYAIQSLIQYIKDPSIENFGKIIEGVGIAVLGLGIAFGYLPATIAGVVITIVGIIVKNWDKIKGFLQKGIDWLTGQMDWVREYFGSIGANIYGIFIDTLQNILNFANNIIQDFKQIFDGIIQFFKGVFTGNWEDVWQGLGKIVSGVFNGILDTFNLIINTIQSTLWHWGQVVGDIFGRAFKGVVNAVLSTIENVLNTPIWAINQLIDAINTLPNVNMNKLNYFNMPRLATGGIINMPNKGTMVGGMAIGGEAGREGVVPLTDQQAMAELGREIGRNVLVNLTNIMQMNGRVISRELKQVQSTQDFAYNM